MKKILLLFFSVFLYANSSYEIASKIVNDSSKNAKLKLLFPDSVYSGLERPNIKAITEALKMNGLLKYSYLEPIDISISFNAEAKAGVFLKAITSAFEQIGVNYYLISEYKKENNKIKLSFVINSKYIIDPGALYEAFLKMNIFIKNIDMDNFNYKYELDFSNFNIKAEYVLNKGDELELSKPLDPYFIKLNDVSKLRINIMSNYIWYPKIEFLDKNLNLIKTYSSDLNTKNMTIKVPKLSEFVVIDDLFTLENIKLGLKIKAEE